MIRYVNTPIHGRATMNTTQAALRQPDASRRRKTSIRTVIAIQMKITYAKKMSKSHRMFRKGYDAARTNLLHLRSGGSPPLLGTDRRSDRWNRAHRRTRSDWR